MDLQLEQLVSLQDIDSKIIELNSLAGDLPQKVKLKEKQIDDLKLRINDNKIKIDDLEKEIRKLNSENEDSQSKLNKYKEQLFLVKSNKEYDALNDEIDYIKKSLSESENKFIAYETNKEELVDSNKNDKNDLEQLTDQLIKQQEILNETQSKSKVELDSLESKKKVIAESLNSNHLMQYNKLIDAMGVAVAPINNNCCGNCFSMMPAQMIIEIKSNNSIISCPSCSVIAFWQEETEEN
tara:strand:- start:149 stop:865 length:717 start_codon:yes stop_codon:yes gene_type:complete